MGATMISVDRDALLGIVKTVGSVVQSKPTIPVLANLLLAGGNGRLTAVATDLDLLCEASCDGVGEIAITVSAATMASAVEGLRPGRCELKVDGGKMVISQGRARRTLPTIPATDFPRLVMEDDAASYDIVASALSRLLTSVSHAQSREETTRPYLCGVLLCVRDKALTAVATNGVSLARAHLDGADMAEGVPDALVSTKAIKTIQSMMPKTEIIHIEVGDSKMAVTFGSARIVTKLLALQFPQFERFIPAPGENVLKVSAGEIAFASAAVASTIQGEGKAALRMVRFDLSQDGEMLVTAQDANGVQAEEPIQGAYTGEPMKIGLNSQLLANLSRMFAESSELSICVEGPAKPVTVRSAAEPDLVGVIQALQV